MAATVCKCGGAQLVLVLVLVLVGVGCCDGSVFIVFCACVVSCLLMCVWACAAFETWFVLLVVGGCRMLACA